jgi:tetratricopeptide (TPR) repeat protein
MRRRKRSGDIPRQGTFPQVHEGVGDNIVNIQVQARGRRHLIEAFPVPRPVTIQGAPPSRLLAADMEVVPFDQRRDPDLSRLEQWRDRPARLQVMLMSGPGGQGKTRLVGEFARRCEDAGWVVAQARHTSELEPGAVPVGPGSSGRLLVVDYAERWPVDDLRDLFTDRFVTQQMATRVLLVARPAGRWWESLRHALFGLVPDPDHLRLGALASGPVDRRMAFEQARNAFAARLGVSEPERIEPPSSLDDPAFGLVLSLHMAALVAVDAHARRQPAPDDPAELTSYLVRREYLHWERMRGSGRIEATALQMAGVTFTATLTRPMSWTAAEEVLTAARVAGSADLARSVMSDHQTCYPAQQAGAGTVLEPLYPDRLGEDFIAVHLTGEAGHELDLADGSFDRIPACLLQETADGRYPGHARHVITTLVETARRWPHVANSYLYPLLRDRPGLAFAAGGATLAALAEQADITLLESLEPHLPADRHVDLDLAAAVITRRLTEHRLAAESDPALRARLNAILAWRLFNAGLYAEALAASVPAVQAYRELAEANPTVFTSGLARALYDLSVLLSALNSDEALAFGWEAAYTYRHLADADPAAFEAEFAGALYFMSVLLTDLGRGEDALSAAEYAVQVYQRLTADGGAGLEPDLARALGSMSGLLSGLGRRDEALAAGHDAVQVYRRLVEARPGEFDEDLARAWRDVAGILRALGRETEALSAADQAVSLYRGLYEANPARFGLGLGEARREQSALLWAVGRKEDAAAGMEEAVDALQQAAVSPFARQLLSRAYNTLAAILAELGRREEALAAKERIAGTEILDDPFVYRRDLAPDDALALADQVVRSYRGLAAANPAAFLSHVPRALRDLSDILAGLGRREDALAATREALRVHSQLATDDPAGSALGLAKTLEQWVALRRLGGQEEALAAAQQAVQAYRALVEHSPETFTPYLPQALRDLSDVLLELGQPEEAVAARQEAAQIYRNMPADSPAGFVGGLIPTSKDGELLQTSNDLAAMLSQMGRWEEALAAKQEAVQICRNQNAGNPQFTPTLTQAFNDLVGILSELGRHQEATAVSQAAKQEAVQIYRQAAVANPPVFALDLANALSDLARFLSDQGRHEEAVAPAQEAVQVYRELAAANLAAFSHDLADRLRVLSVILSELGRQEDALAAVQEAVQVHQRLALAYPAAFAPHLAEVLGNLSASLRKRQRREDPFAVTERIFWDSVPLARQNGLTFIVGVHDTDDAAGFARLLADVRNSEPEAATVVLASPVGGSKFFAPGTFPVAWYEENVPPSSAVVHILDHEPGLSRQLQGIPGTFYVGVPELAAGEEYGDSVRIVVTANVLDFATMIMRDYSSPTSLHGVIFDETEALRMRNLAANWPDFMDPAAWGMDPAAGGHDPTPSGPFSFGLTRESQQHARSAYRSPERSVLPGTA